MHSLFKDKFPEENVTYLFYLNYFHENYLYLFGRPQKDVCSLCEELSTKLRNPSLNDNAKKTVAAEKMIHIRRSKKFYNKIKEVE